MTKHYKKYAVLIYLLCLIIANGILTAQTMPKRVEVYYSVSVVGAVVNPGVYQVIPTSRVSEVLFKANYIRDTLLVDIEKILRNSSTRNIILKRGDKTTKVDLEKFNTYGDETNNPYISDGDVIFVPVRDKTISIYGAVNRSGTYELVEGDKISDIIELAMGLRDDAYLGKAEVVRFKDNHIDTEILTINLQNVIDNPASTDNVLLKNDDRIFIKAIPEYHKREELKVTVSGAVKNPDEYNLTEGYRLSDAIAISGGLRDDAYLGKAEVVRFKDNHINTEVLSVNLNKIIDNPECEDNILLKNDDRIFIRSIPEFHEKKGVTVSGEVRFPGAYSIEEGKTYLSEILEKCGGPTDKADLKNAYLQRRRSVDIVDPEFERLKKMLVEDMTDMEYEYFKTKSRELKGIVPIDFGKLLLDKDKGADILLKSGDFIYFPDKTITITVSGQVKSPGLITFIPGRNYLYYINKAGGYAWRARKSKIRLIKAVTGEWLKPDKNTKIEVGDMIFIPEKKEYDYWQIAKDVMKVAADIATVLIVIQNVKW